jgi:hypothetical protein
MHVARRSKVTALNQEPKHIDVDEFTMRLFNELITKVHNHLEDAKIKILFRTDPKWSKHYEIGITRGIMLLLSGVNITIVINRISWKDRTIKTKYAFADMILCACGVKIDDKGSKTYFKQKPDIEGYRENYERWGQWTVTYQDFVRITNQLQLFENGGVIELAREANEMRDLEDYYHHIDSVYGNPDAFPIIHDLPVVKAVNQ